MKTGELVHHLRVLDCEQCYLCRECKGPHKLKCFLFGDAADMLDAQQKRIKELEAERRWIPVTERLPKPFESVLALIPSEAPLPTVHESYIADHDEWVCILTAERYKPGEVTHWMPMPEMMKEGNKNG